MTEINQLVQHFNQSETDFIKQAKDWISQAVNDYRLVLTKFLNPRQRYILQTLVNQESGLQIAENGVFDSAESKRVIIAPDVFEIIDDDYEIKLLELHFPIKFAELHHKDLLGSLMNAGIDRNTFGDIVVSKELGAIQVAVDKALVAFLQDSIERIGHTKITWHEKQLSEAFEKTIDGQEKFVLVNSLRLDAVVATVFNLSRSVVTGLIDQGQIQINWAVTDKKDRQISIKDVISVRKYGRISLESLSGHSKKDKIKAVFNIIHR